MTASPGVSARSPVGSVDWSGATRNPVPTRPHDRAITLLHSRHRTYRFWILIVGCALAGCESTVDLGVDGDYHFSLYGVLNPVADTQAVMVFPIHPTLRPWTDDPFAQLVSEDEFGESVVWRDSVVAKDDGPVHVFWAPFRPRYGSRHRLEVSSLETEGTASANVVVPGQASVSLGVPYDDFGVSQDIRVTPGVPRLNGSQLVYLIQARLPAAWRVLPVLVPGASEPVSVLPPPSDSLVVQPLRVPIDLAGSEVRMGDEWVYTVNYSQHLREIWSRLRRRGRVDTAFGVRFLGLEFRAVAASADWIPPGGQFDPDVLIQPGTLSNVEGGFGFVGSGYQLALDYGLSPELLERIGFRMPDGG